MKSPSKLVNVARQKDALTENLAITNSTSLHSVVDLFFVAGATRTMTEIDIRSMLECAWVENALLTLKVIFWAGDIRQGQGERRFFRIALEWLEDKYRDTFLNNVHLVSEFSRWDSLFHLDSDQILDLIHKALYEEKNGLCAKWMPRKKQYNNFASRFRKKYALGFKEYRDLIVKLSKTVEQKMCAKEWNEIKYDSVPSVAFNKYRAAFLRNDQKRFQMFLDSVEKGESKIHADAIFPYQIYNSYKSGKADEKSIDLQWKALPNYIEKSKERILPVCDVSGSMYGLPMSISVSLGIYLSERNVGIFQDAFVTFSGSPKMEYLKGTLTQRMNQLEHAHWDANTDLNAVFRLILRRAISENVKESEMPTMILIISDMEFDSCAELTNYEKIKQDYQTAGYKIPKIVFWNVDGRRGNVPVSYDKKEVALVSGASPSNIKNILSGKKFDPESIMLETLSNKRYDVLKV